MKDSIEISCANCRHYGVCAFSPTAPSRMVNMLLPFRKGAYETQVLNEFTERVDRAYAEACLEYLPNTKPYYVPNAKPFEAPKPVTELVPDTLREARLKIIDMVQLVGIQSVNRILAEAEPYPDFAVTLSIIP